MEKSAEFQIKVFKQDGKLLMRLPGGEEIPYDFRFGELDKDIYREGAYRIFPVEG